MIVVSGGTKGGSGKTTIATNLAILRAAEGRDVLLVDADDQETASDFTVLRNERLNERAGYTSIKLTGAAVRTEIKRQTGKYDDIIIDAGGRDTASQRAALTVADVLLAPFVPRSFDVWTIEKVSELIQEIQPVNPDLVGYTFLNRADPSGPDNDAAADVLREVEALRFLATPLVYRKAFGKAAAQGLAVTELRPMDDKAVAEVMALSRAVFDGETTSKANVTPRQEAELVS